MKPTPQYSLLHLDCHLLILKSQSIILFSKSLLTSFVEKRPTRMRLEIEIESLILFSRSLLPSFLEKWRSRMRMGIEIESLILFFRSFLPSIVEKRLTKLRLSIDFHTVSFFVSLFHFKCDRLYLYIFCVSLVQVGMFLESVTLVRVWNVYWKHACLHITRKLECTHASALLSRISERASQSESKRYSSCWVISITQNSTAVKKVCCKSKMWIYSSVVSNN